MEQTTNYQLSQWEAADRILMEDFNGNNAKIDAAIKAEAEARQAGDDAEAAARDTLAAKVAKLGNCQLWMGTYVGDGRDMHQASQGRTLTFPKPPMAVFFVRAMGSVFVPLIRGMDQSFLIGRANNYFNAAWEGNTIRWWTGYEPATGMNEKDVTYYVVALLAADK